MFKNFGIVVFAVLSIAFAGSVKVSSSIPTNAKMNSTDVQREFYGGEFPSMYNAVIRDIDTVYSKVGLIKGSSYATQTYNPPSINNAANKDSSFYFAGATTSSIVLINPPPAFEDGLNCRAWIPAADSVRIRIINFSAAPIDPASGTWKIVVTKY
jgi:hypothetical protein